MTSPRINHRGQLDARQLDRYTLLLAAAACWMLLLLIGLVLTFS